MKQEKESREMKMGFDQEQYTQEHEMTSMRGTNKNTDTDLNT